MSGLVTHFYGDFLFGSEGLLPAGLIVITGKDLSLAPSLAQVSALLHRL